RRGLTQRPYPGRPTTYRTPVSPAQIRSEILPGPPGAPLTSTVVDGILTLCLWKANSQSMRRTSMLSARNQIPATVKSGKLGNVMAEVVMSVGNIELVAAITRGSAEQLGLKAGDSVKAVIKATEILVDKP